MAQSFLECRNIGPHSSNRMVFLFFSGKVSLYKTACEAEMTVVSLAERSLTAVGDTLLCNWDFKSTCSTRVTFQCLSPPAWQELMTANNAIFKASPLQPSTCEYSIAYIMWYDCVLFLHIIPEISFLPFLPGSYLALLNHTLLFQGLA